MKINQIFYLSIASLMLAACSATNPGLFKTNQPLTLEHSEVRDNLNLPFNQFINHWLPAGAVNQTFYQLAKVMSYVSQDGDSRGVRPGEKVESYSATDSNGADRQIIPKAKDTFQAWCTQHSGKIGTLDNQHNAFIEKVLQRHHNPSQGLYYGGGYTAFSCAQNNQVIATLAYTEGKIQGISNDYYFPGVLLFVKDWSK